MCCLYFFFQKKKIKTFPKKQSQMELYLAWLDRGFALHLGCHDQPFSTMSSSLWQTGTQETRILQVLGQRPIRPAYSASFRGPCLAQLAQTSLLWLLCFFFNECRGYVDSTHCSWISYGKPTGQRTFNVKRHTKGALGVSWWARFQSSIYSLLINRFHVQKKSNTEKISANQQRTVTGVSFLLSEIK